MRINVKTQIVDYDNNPIIMGVKPTPEKEKNNPDYKPEPIYMLLGNMIIKALNDPIEGEKNVSSEKKIHRAVISQDVFKAMKEDGDGMTDLTSEDITEIKELMNHFYTPLPLMRAFEILDPKPQEVSKKAKS